eukprot:2179326-Alexandrium_andersonii.AAC.1
MPGVTRALRGTSVAFGAGRDMSAAPMPEIGCAKRWARPALPSPCQQNQIAKHNFGAGLWRSDANEGEC